jgi:predicted outer membrane protein
MSALLRSRVGVAAAGLSFLLLGYAVAQQVQTSDQAQSDQPRAGAPGQFDRSSAQPATQPGDRTYRETAERRIANYRGANAIAGAQSQVVDHYLATCILGKNEAEVQLSEIAQQKSDNAQVKQFAEQMVQDHKKLIEQLQPLAAMQAGAKRGVSESISTQSETERAASPTETAATTPPINTTAETTTGAAATERPMIGGTLHQLGQIEKQIGERCLQNAKEELQQKSGAEFDKCYVGMAVGAHMQALAALEVIGQQTQGQLAQVAKQAQPTVQQHLDHAKQLMKQLEGQGASSTAERSSSTRTE